MTEVRPGMGVGFGDGSRYGTATGKTQRSSRSEKNVAKSTVRRKELPERVARSSNERSPRLKRSR